MSRNQSVGKVLVATATVALVLALLNVGPAPAHAGILYFSGVFRPTFNDGAIQRVNTDGTGLQTVIDIGGGLRSLDLDQTAGKVYWTDVTNLGIRRANLDGSQQQDLVTTGLQFPSAVRVYPMMNQMFWGDQLSNELWRANQDGSNPELLRSTAFHRGMALDTTHNKIYWTTSDTIFKGKILRSNLDGSQLETVVDSLAPEFKPASIALDVAGGKVYWTDYVVDVVRRANLDGSNIEDLYTVGSNLNPGGIALDLTAGKVYWGQDTGGEETSWNIMSMNLDGSLPKTVITNLGQVVDMTFVPEPAALVILLAGALVVLRPRG